jgi:hypothetical protein
MVRNLVRGLTNGGTTADIKSDYERAFRIDDNYQERPHITFPRLSYQIPHHG